MANNTTFEYWLQSPSNTPNTSTVSPQTLTRRDMDQILRMFYNVALDVTGEEEAAKILTSIAAREGGLYGGVGDVKGGGSFGPLQFYAKGQLPNFAKFLGVDAKQASLVARDQAQWDKVIKFAWENYLGQAVNAGRQKGLTGPALASFASQYGQRSINPEASGQQYMKFFGGPAPAMTPNSGRTVQEPSTFPTFESFLSPWPFTQATGQAPRPEPSVGAPTGPAGTVPRTGVGRTMTGQEKPGGALQETWRTLAGPYGWHARQIGNRALAALGMPQAAIEHLMTQGGRFEDTEEFHTVSRLIAKWARQHTKIETGRIITDEEAEVQGAMVTGMLMRFASDPLNFVSALPKILGFIGKGSKLANEINNIENATEMLNYARIGEKAADPTALVTKSLDYAKVPGAKRGPIVVTPEGIAVLPIEGQPMRPVLTPLGRPSFRVVDVESPRAGYPVKMPFQVRGPDGKMRTVVAYVEPMEPRALPAPRPFVRVSPDGAIIELEASRIISEARKLVRETAEVVYEEPGLSSTIGAMQIGQIGKTLPPIAGGEEAAVALGSLTKKMGRLSRVGAYLDRMGPAGVHIHRMFRQVIHDVDAYVGSQFASVIEKAGMKRFPTLSEAQNQALAENLILGKASSDPLVKSLSQAIRDSYNDAKQIIVENNIPGYVNEEDLPGLVQKFGINPESVRHMPKKGMFELPAEEWTKTFNVNYHVRRYNWDKIEGAYGKAADKQKIIDYLVRSKQAPNKAEAEAMLLRTLQRRNAWVDTVIPDVDRPLMHFQYPRKLPQLPTEYYLPAFQAFRSYLEELGGVVAFQKNFGRDGNMLRAAYDAIVQTPGADRSFLNNTMAWMFGKIKEDDIAETLSAALSNITVLSKMGLSTISQAGQISHIYSMVGAKNLLKALAAQSAHGYVDAFRFGAIISPANMAKEMAIGSAASAKFLQATKFITMDQWLRSTAFQGGRFLYDDLIDAMKNKPDSAFANIGKRWLKEADIDSSKALKPVSPEEMENFRGNFGYWVANETQFRGSLVQSPLFRQSAVGKTIMTLRGFSYSQAAFVTKRLFGEAFKGNPMPLFRWAMASLPLGSAIIFTRAVVPAALVGIPVGLIKRRPMTYEDIRAKVKERFRYGFDTPAHIALTWFDSMMAVGAYGIASDIARSLIEGPEIGRQRAAMQAVAGVPISVAIDTAVGFGAPAITAYNYLLAPPEEKMELSLGEEMGKALRTVGSTAVRLAPAVGAEAATALGLRTNEATRRHHLKMLKRAVATGDDDSFEYWYTKLVEETGQGLDQDVLERWLKQTYR